MTTLTIIETGLAPDPIRARFPDYPAMFRRLIGDADASIGFETVSVVKGEPLPDPTRLDAALITGSPAGVYDPEPWMPALMDFIRWAAIAGTPQIGVCFGHQAIAQAMGGQVTKSDKGWGVGRHCYDIAHVPPGLEPAPQQMRYAVSHQDQVIAAPPGARLVAASAFTPLAAFTFEQAPIITVQGHPEFADDFAAALYDCRRDRMGDALVDEAIGSLARPHDNAESGRWFASFLIASAKAG